MGWRGLGFFLAALFTLAAPARAASDLETLKANGFIKIAVYKEFFPFSDDGAGIDIDLANEIGKRMQLRVTFLPFDAGEDMKDDFRNMVWKGHYMGYGPADILMHVPIDRVLEEKNPEVEIFGAYCHESVRLAIDTEKIPDWQGPEVLLHERIAVDGDSIGAQVALAADAGKYRDHVGIDRNVKAAAESVRQGKSAAMVASRSELEATLGLGHRYKLVDVAWPQLPVRGWAVGMAVRKDRTDLAKAVNEALDSIVRDGTLKQIFSAHGVTLISP